MDPTFDPSQLPLRDIHLPDAVQFWPPAPGWWLLAALVLGVLAALAVHRYRHRQQRAALRAVESIRLALVRGAEPAECAQRLSSVMRRFAMTTAHDGNELAADERARGKRMRADAAGVAAASAGAARGAHDDVAGLVGTAWLEYLDSRWSRDEFTRGTGRLLTAAPYAPPENVERLHALELAELCAEWLKAQRRAHAAPMTWSPRPRAAARSA